MELEIKKSEVETAIDEIENELLSSKEITTEIQVEKQMVEPFTFMWIIASIAAGILSYLGGKLAENIFKGFFSNQSNIENVLRAFMEKLLYSIQQIIHIEKIRSYHALFQAVTRELAYYSNDNDIERLRRAEGSIIRLRGLYASLPVAGFHGYMAATSMHIAILILRENKEHFKNKKNTRKNISIVAREGVQFYNYSFKVWEFWSNSRFSGLYGPTSKGNFFYDYYHYTFNGALYPRVAPSAGTPAGWTKLYTDHMKLELEKTYKVHLYNREYLKLIDGWSKLQNLEIKSGLTLISMLKEKR